jgi:GNAT superfamily N-acetyltransferase
MPVIGEWSPDRLADLLGLTDLALPGERLTGDELLACCWDDGGVVLGTGDDQGAVSAVVRSFGEHRLAWIKLVAVHPDAHRQGTGSALVEAAESWAFDHGASSVQLANSAPFYLWPGVDTTMLGMLCLAEACGYLATGSELNMSLTSTFRAPSPPGVVLRRVLDDAEVAAVADFVGGHWPHWLAELHRAAEQGGCHGAFDEASGRPVGFACHSVNRAGWVGPMGTDPTRRAGGVGWALLGELCRDLMVAKFDEVEISWVGPVRFYAKAGATVSRSFRTYSKTRP